jgi:hypothetical protein
MIFAGGAADIFQSFSWSREADVFDNIFLGPYIGELMFFIF